MANDDNFDGNNHNLFAQILKYWSLYAEKLINDNDNRKFSVSPSNFRWYKFYWFTFAPHLARVYGDKRRDKVTRRHVVVVIFAANIATRTSKMGPRVESHLGIILQKRRQGLHICITFACVNTSAEAHTLSSYPIYLGENAPPQRASRASSLQPCRLVIAQVLVTNSNDLFHCGHILYIEAINRY